MRSGRLALVTINTMGVRRELRQRLPAPLVRTLRAWPLRRREKQYRSQRLVTVRCGSYELTVPESHVLVTHRTVQPFRDLCVGIAAQHISRKYPVGTFVDVGANVGDTAAMMATHADNPLILVEPSDYFFDLLARNVAQLPNVRRLKKVLVANGGSIAGDFEHRSGTASFRADESGSVRTMTERLSRICDDTTCFIKLDTDGYDFLILRDSMDFLASQRPAILFENQIRTVEDLDASNQVLAALSKVGYSGFVVWDDPGFHLVSTTEIEVLQDLNSYLFNVWTHPGHRSICNYDVLCLHDRDVDLFASISRWWRTRPRD
jgi:FkbM family methyltransferase